MFSALQTSPPLLLSWIGGGRGWGRSVSLAGSASNTGLANSFWKPSGVVGVFTLSVLSVSIAAAAMRTSVESLQGQGGKEEVIEYRIGMSQQAKDALILVHV